MMTSSKLSFILSIACFISVYHELSAQVPGFELVEWKKEKIAKGLTWKHAHTSQLFNTPQNINILEIDTRKRAVTLVYDKDKNRTTSELSKENGAIASVNAGFFDMKNGGSVTYIKVDGSVPDSDTSKWKKTETLNGAFIIKSTGSFEVESAGEYHEYTANDSYDDVLVTGCILMDEGKRMKIPDVAFVTKRHPRTSLGLTSKHKIILVTVDGRSDQASGMSLHELTDLMISLKCEEAINLDGGGSTTMWLKDQGPTGVVNKPSDNKKFDHEGERAVSNILVVQ